MSTVTSKPMSEKDANQVLQFAYNDHDATISTSGFLDGKIGHRLKVTPITATMDETRYFDEVNTQSATFTSGLATVTVTNTLGLSVGQYVLLDIGTTGIPDGTTIQSIDTNTQITMTQTFGNSTGSYTAHFANLLKRIRTLYNNSTHDILLDASRVE